MGNIRLGQILIAGSIGFLVFFGILLTEKSRFEQVQYIRNPFKESQILKEEVENLNEDEKVLNFLEKSGEIWQVFPNARIDFSEGHRSLKKGTIVYSSHFISDKNSKKASHSFKPNINISTLKPLIGQIKVGDLMINAPSSIILIKKDNIRGEIEIYAHDHSVELFFPNSETPYVLPPRHRVLLKEKHINQVGGLFYTKQNKEFDLRLIAPSINTEDETLKIPEEIINTQDFRNKIYKKIVLFAQNEPLTWTRFQPASLMGIFVDGIQYLQRYYGLGVTDEHKKIYEYYTLRKKLIDSFFYFEQKNYIKAESSATKFEKILHGTPWTRFMIENPNFMPDWEIFERSHKIHINRLYSERKEKLFEKIWFPKKKFHSFDVFKERYFMIENLISQKEGTLAKSEMDILGDAFFDVKDKLFDKRAELTKIRRLLESVLREGPFFHSLNVFDFYGKLIQQETNLYDESNGSQQEISLEASRNILYFLQIFIDKKSNSDIAQNLVQVYKFLKIDEINQRLGRSVFSEKEKETIKMVQFINGQNLTDDDIEKIQEDQTIREFYLQQLSDEQNAKNEPDEFIDDGINTEDGFIQILQNSNVNVDGIRVKIREESGLISFSETHFKKYPLKGTFNIKQQSFTFLQLKNEVQNGSIPLFTLRPILNSLTEKVLDNQSALINSNEPEQTSNLGILRATVLSRMLGKQNISVERTHIKPLDKAFKKFRVSNALFNHRYKLEFDFIQVRKKDFQLQNIKVEAGANKFNLSDTFKVSGLSESLSKAIEVKLGE